MKRKILSMVLTFCLLLSMFPALVPGASAEEPEEEYIVEEPAELEPEEEIDAIAEDPVVEPLDGDGTTVLASGYCGGEDDGTNLTWTLTDDGTLTISGTGAMADYKYDSSNGTTTAPWFEYKSSMTTLVLEDGITTFGSYAFRSCSGFAGNLVIPDSVTSIGGSSFYGCSGFAGDLVIGSSVTTIDKYAFYGCSGFTGDLVIGDSATSIGSYAFYGCSGFTGNLVIPDSVTSIGCSAFWNCSGFTGDLVIGDNVTSIGDSAFSDCSGFTGNLVIGDSVTSIGSGAFSSCSSFTGNLEIPDSVVSIGYRAFYNCSGFFGSLVIPDSVTSIGSSAFWACSGFTGDLVIGNSVTSIGNYAFYKCSGFTGDLVIPDSVTIIEESTFSGCSGFNGELKLSNTLVNIKYYAFSGCFGLTGDLMIPASVKNIGNDAFAYRTGLSGKVYFAGDAPTVVAATANYPSFDKNVDLYCVPGTTGWTDSDAYDADAGTWNGYKLDTWDGTDESNVLASGYCGGEGDGTNLTWTLTDDGTLTISGEGAMADYTDYKYSWSSKITAPWAEYKTNLTALVIEGGVSSIGDYAFYECSGFTGNLVIPDSVTSIGDWAFESCSGFTGNLEIPDSVTSIENSFIDGCSGISRIEVSTLNTAYASKDGVLYDVEFSKAIRAPEGISGTLEIPDSVTEIYSAAFYDCSGFTGDLVIPDGVTRIGQWAFSGCSGFNGNLVIPNSVTDISDWAFQNCSGLTGNLVIPDSVAFAGEMGTFCGCSGFTGDLVIPEGMYWIASEMFQGCTSMSGNVYFKGNAPGVVSASDDRSSFPSDFTLYYIPGTSGWIDSEYYDADAGTWNGYKLLTWDGGNTDEPSFPISGYCGGEGDGTNLTWTLTEDGTLTISGTGKMADYDWDSAPWAGYKDSLKTLVIESGVTTIGNNAFKDCSGFTGDLVIPDGVTTIGDSAFSHCNGFTGELNIPDSVTYIGKNAFTRCEGFDGKLTISTSVTSIEYATFSECGFTGELVIPDGVTRIDGFAFSCLNSGFTGELVIPSSVTSIGECAFQRCSGFTGELVIPGSVTSIGDSAFHSCSGFTGTLVIPSTVKEIGSSPFSGTSGITWIEVESANPNYASKDGILHDKDFSIVIQAPGGLSGELNIPDSVTTIGKSAFYFCKNLTGDLVIPNGVTSIGDGAFNNCSGFTGSLVIPDGVTSIESLTFGYCSGFSGDLVIPSGVSSIGILAFDGCTGLSGDVYFEGNAPTVTAASEVFHSFPTDFTLYYTPGTTGWTDSEYYDADAGTWNGYKLEAWDTSEIDEDAPRLVVQPVTGRPGDTVEVKINVENNPGLVGIATMVTFDSTVLEYVSCEISSEFSGVNNSHLNGNTLKTIWVTGDEAVTVNDTFLTITFKINEDAEDGDTYITLDYDYDNTLDADEECIELATFGDYVTVFSGILGDVNNSGTVTSLDVRWILQYLSGAREFSEDQLALADVNSSGTVTSLDVRWILQYLSGARDENYQAK